MVNNNTTNLTPPRVPLVDPTTGLITREWYRFFLNLYTTTGTTAVDADLLLMGPAATNNDELLNLFNQVQSADQTASQLAVLQNEIQSLAVAPTMPEVQALVYGAFRRTDAATATAINTAQTVTFQYQDVAKGIEWVSGTPTRIYVYSPGVYNFQFSAEMTKSSANLGYAWIWPAINGVDVPNSASRVSFQGSNSDLIAAWNWFLTMSAGDYFELKWAVDDLNTTLVYDATTAFAPAIPSVILTANRVSL